MNDLKALNIDELAEALWREASRQPGADWPDAWDEVCEDDRDDFRLVARIAIETFKKLLYPTNHLN
jgi:hypothetical protein